jgi:hypothetical protein
MKSSIKLPLEQESNLRGVGEALLFSFVTHTPIHFEILSNIFNSIVEIEKHRENEI